MLRRVGPARSHDARVYEPMSSMTRPGPGEPFGGRGNERPLGKVREMAEREHILSILRLTDGRRGQAAHILGISRKTLWKKLKDYGIHWPDVTEP